MHWRKEWQSKLVDGYLVALALILFSLLLGLLIRPIQIQFGKPGLLVYAVFSLAAAIVALERSVNQKVNETYRAMWGLGGGILTWAVIELSNMVGAQAAISETGVLLFMLVATSTGVLWKRVLPEGLKFFLVMFLASWGSYQVINGLIILQSAYTEVKTVILVLGYVCAGLLVLFTAWIMLGSRTRTDRMWCAMAIWICSILLLYIFRGGLF